MSGFNLPPGVSVSDIPGNRPEDEAWEGAAERFLDALADLLHDHESEALTAEGVWELLEEYVNDEVERRARPADIGNWAKQPPVPREEIDALARRVVERRVDGLMDRVPEVKTALRTDGLTYWVRVGHAATADA